MPRNSSVNYYLTTKDEDGKCSIFLQYVYAGHRLKFSFGQRVKPGNWNKAKQRVKNNRETTEDSKFLLNDLLDNLEKVCISAYNSEIKNGIPKPATLKKYLQDFLYQNHNDDGPDTPSLFKLIERFKAGEIKSKGKDKSKGSLQNYHAVMKHLQQFQAKHRAPVNFDSIDLDFFYRYTAFLKNGLNLSHNTVAKDIRLLKVFMGEAVDLGYTDNLQFKHKKFSYAEVDTDAVYLKEKEIIDLYRFDLSHSKKLEQVRDLFVFGCFVGLRFSDFSDIKPENIIKMDGEYFIKLYTKKTQDLVIIPCSPVVLDIFKKYDSNRNKLPKSLSNQKFNDYIKEACKLAGMEEKGRLATNPELELSQCISSHTARRSFATNYYLQGFPTIDLMKITGHKTEKAFLKYIRVTKLDTAKRLSQFIKKNWSEKMLRVAS